ncbi:MAG: sulfotransferase [Candidatus Buchananbacteria bacterium]
MPEIERPIFVIGCNNSGTSPFTKALQSHRQICGPPPMENTDDFGQRHPMEIIDLPGMPSIVRRQLGECSFRALGCAEFKGIDYVTEEQCTPAIAQEIRLALGRFTQPGKRFLGKNPSNVLRARLYQAVFLDADFIGIYRNGYAVAEGTRRKRLLDPERLQFAGLNITITQAATNWNNNNTVMLSMATTYLRRCLLVAYENLVEDPASTFKNVLDFLGLPTNGFQAPCLKKDLNKIQIERLTREEISHVTEAAWPMLRHFDYRILSPEPDREKIMTAGLDRKA